MEKRSRRVFTPEQKFAMPEHAAESRLTREAALSQNCFVPALAF
jgi:hypothetical protein